MCNGKGLWRRSGERIQGVRNDWEGGGDEKDGEKGEIYQKREQEMEKQQ